MIPCVKCKKNSVLKQLVQGSSFKCSYCGTNNDIYLFPALLKPISFGEQSENIIMDTEASCFVHENKKAVSSCKHCGVYVCSLCEIPKGGETFCAKCFNIDEAKVQEDEITRVYKRHSAIVSWLSFFPIFMYFTYPFAYPYAIYYTCKNWSKRESFFQGPRRVKMVVSLLISGLFVGGVVLTIIFSV